MRKITELENELSILLKNADVSNDITLYNGLLKLIEQSYNEGYKNGYSKSKSDMRKYQMHGGNY